MDKFFRRITLLADIAYLIIVLYLICMLIGRGGYRVITHFWE